MGHTVRTFVKGEPVEVQLPVFTGTKQVRAALIVALGVGVNPGETRLALLGGAHVDVTKAWMQKNAPQAGKHYFVQDAEGYGEAQPASVFEVDFLGGPGVPPDNGPAVGPDFPPDPFASGASNASPAVTEGAGIPVTGTIGAVAVEANAPQAAISEFSELAGAEVGLPSAEDLDVVAELQKAADATGTGETESNAQQQQESQS